MSVPKNRHYNDIFSLNTIQDFDFGLEYLPELWTILHYGCKIADPPGE